MHVCIRKQGVLNPAMGPSERNSIGARRYTGRTLDEKRKSISFTPSGNNPDAAYCRRVEKKPVLAVRDYTHTQSVTSKQNRWIGRLTALPAAYCIAIIPNACMFLCLTCDHQESDSTCKTLPNHPRVDDASFSVHYSLYIKPHPTSKCPWHMAKLAPTAFFAVGVSRTFYRTTWPNAAVGISHTPYSTTTYTNLCSPSYI